MTLDAKFFYLKIIIIYTSRPIYRYIDMIPVLQLVYLNLNIIFKAVDQRKPVSGYNYSAVLSECTFGPLLVQSYFMYTLLWIA